MSIKDSSNVNCNRDWSKLFRSIVRLLSIVGFIASFYLVYKGYQAGIFSSEDALADFLDKIGSGAPLILIFLQAFRTVTKIIPAAITLPVGVLLFGQVKGLIYNSIGCIIGAVILFYLARTFGEKLVIGIIGDEKYNKFSHYLDSEGKFKTILTVILFLPVGPHDIFCLLAGLSNIDTKDFLIRLCLSKPFSTFIYTNMLLSTFRFLESLFI